MKTVLLVLAISVSAFAAPKPLEEKPILLKASLKIRGQILSVGLNLQSNQSGMVDNPNYRMVLTPQVRDGKMIEVTADILEKVDGGFRRVATPKIVTLPGQEATISQFSKTGFELKVEPNVD